MRKIGLVFLMVWGLVFAGNLGAQGWEHYEKRWHGGAKNSSGHMEMEGRGMQGQGMMGSCPMMMPASPEGVSPQMLKERAQMMREMAQMMEEMARKMESGKVTQKDWDQFRSRMHQMMEKRGHACPMHREMHREMHQERHREMPPGNSR